MRIVKAIVLALLLALLLAVVGSIVAGVGQENALFAVFFWVGLISFFILFLKVQRVGFWFCLSYAIEWDSGSACPTPSGGILVLPVLRHRVGIVAHLSGHQHCAAGQGNRGRRRGRGHWGRITPLHHDPRGSRRLHTVPSPGPARLQEEEAARCQTDD